MGIIRGSAALSLLVIVPLAVTACSILFPSPTPAPPEPPRATFEIRWLDNFTVELNAFGSSAAEGRQMESYQWDFGDGNQVTDHLYVVQHRYEQPGHYLITLTVQDDAGLAASIQKDVVVVLNGEVGFEKISGFNNRQVYTQIGLVVHTQEEFDRLWQEALGDYTPSPAPPTIDFKKEMVVAVFLGTRPSSGYGIRVDRIRVEDGWLKVWYTETQPGYGCAVLTVISYPTLWLRAERVDLPVLFFSRVEVVPCPR
jgi:PKD repeat protein